jgi:uncharacterized protein YndB with AHSA1/START domain
MKVEQSILIAAKRERVWQGWVEEISAWWSKPYYIDPENVTGLILEPRLGGRFIEEWGKDAGYLIGHVIEWLPPQRLAYTWSEKSWAGVITVVRLEFISEKDQTRIDLIHDGFERLPDGKEQRKSYEHGSADLLGKLKTYVEKRQKT